MGCGTSTQGSPRTKHVSGGEMSATEKCKYDLFILFAYINLNGLFESLSSQHTIQDVVFVSDF